jgi:outer membrane protein
MTALLIGALLAQSGAAQPQSGVPQPSAAQAQQSAPQPQSRVLTLEEAVHTARQRQPQLREAHANTNAAEARADQARAPLLPQLGVNAEYQRTTANFAARPGSVPSTVANGGTTSGSSSFKTFNFWNGGATLNQLIFDFGTSIDRWRAAKAQADAQRATELATVLGIDFTVRQNYFLAQAQKALVQVAQDTLNAQTKHREQTEGFVRAGTQPEIALATARTNEANARVQLITAQNNYETAKVTLNQAMGVESGTDYDVARDPYPAIDVEDSEIEPVVAEAVKARPEVASIEDLIRVNQLTINSVRGNYFPSISGQANVTDQGTALDALTWNANVGVVLSWNIFQGGLTSAQIREAQANLANVAAQLDVEKQQIRVDVNAALLAVRASKASLSATGEALNNAQLQLKLAEQRFQVGVGSAIELTDAQVALTQAAAQSVQAADNLSTARAQLVRALGRQ